MQLHTFISYWLFEQVIMIDRETPLAKIIGQMLLSKNTDISYVMLHML